MTYSTARTQRTLDAVARRVSGRWRLASWTRSIPPWALRTSEFHPATVWRPCQEIGKASTAFASTNGTGCASSGSKTSRMRSKSSTTIEELEAFMIRLPTHREPTHPGDMLLEEFLQPLGLSQRDLAAGI